MISSLLMALPALGSGGGAASEAAGDASGRQVVERYLEALGGAEALQRIDSFHITGTYAIPAAGLEGTLDLYFSRPDRILFRVELPGIGVIRQGFDGEVGWRIDPQRGVALIQGEEAARQRRWIARGFSILPRVDAYESVSGATEAPCEGAVCALVTLRFPGDPGVVEELYDRNTGLLLERREAGIAGEGEVLGWVSGYRPWRGIVVATQWRHQAGGQEWTATYESFEVNSVDDSVYQLPVEIQALLDAQ